MSADFDFSLWTFFLLESFPCAWWMRTSGELMLIEPRMIVYIPIECISQLRINITKKTALLLQFSFLLPPEMNEKRKNLQHAARCCSFVFLSFSFARANTSGQKSAIAHKNRNLISLLKLKSLLSGSCARRLANHVESSASLIGLDEFLRGSVLVRHRLVS